MLLLVACSAPESQNAVEHATSAPKPQSAQTPAMDSKSPPSVSVVAALERVVRKGMAYADFRNEAMAQGWTPVVDPECRTNV
ncbi:MAG TPA: hypothetical protein VGQ93_04100, partial [Lysobacter sp.]|nr:hypothetical protein [Lysobacter sp.]